MDPKYYCHTTYSELTGLKARLYDILKALNNKPKDVRTKLMDQAKELHTLVDDLTHKIDQLKVQCPADWSPHKKEIEAKKKALVEKINFWDAEHIAGGYVGG